MLQRHDSNLGAHPQLPRSASANVDVPMNIADLRDFAGRTVKNVCHAIVRSTQVLQQRRQIPAERRIILHNPVQRGGERSELVLSAALVSHGRENRQVVWTPLELALDPARYLSQNPARLSG